MGVLGIGAVVGEWLAVVEVCTMLEVLVGMVMTDIVLVGKGKLYKRWKEKDKKGGREGGREG